MTEKKPHGHVKEKKEEEYLRIECRRKISEDKSASYGIYYTILFSSAKFLKFSMMELM